MIIECAKCGHLHNDPAAPFPHEVVRGEDFSEICSTPVRYINGEFKCEECGTVNTVTMMWGLVEDDDEPNKYFDDTGGTE